jgi:homoserine dehydrogenase
MTKQKLRIGLFGYGCVGSGLYEVLKRTPNFNAEIVKICVKDKTKPRNIPAHNFTYDKNEILNDETINVVVELIDNADDAYEIVTTALREGKAVVTANKKLLSEHFTELYLLQQQYNTPLLYEASVGGAIPIIRTLEEYYDNDTLSSIEGILNGTTNFILTKTANEGKGYEEVLKEAQLLGFAESNPTLDVQAFDPKFKLTILLAHAFGLIVKPERS